MNLFVKQAVEWFQNIAMVDTKHKLQSTSDVHELEFRIGNLVTTSSPKTTFVPFVPQDVFWKLVQHWAGHERSTEEYCPRHQNREKRFDYFETNLYNDDGTRSRFEWNYPQMTRMEWKSFIDKQLVSKNELIDPQVPQWTLRASLVREIPIKTVLVDRKVRMIRQKSFCEFRQTYWKIVASEVHEFDSEEELRKLANIHSAQQFRTYYVMWPCTSTLCNQTTQTCKSICHCQNHYYDIEIEFLPPPPMEEIDIYMASIELETILTLIFKEMLNN